LSPGLTQENWALMGDPILLGPTLDPKANKSSVMTQFSWVWHQDPLDG